LSCFLPNGEEWPRPIGSKPIIIQNLKNKHKYTALALYNGAKGRQKSQGLPYEVGMEHGLEIHPWNLAALVLLSRQDIGNEVVPVEEPPSTEYV
jgi:hypothetical protein